MLELIKEKSGVVRKEDHSKEWFSHFIKRNLFKYIFTINSNLKNINLYN